MDTGKALLLKPLRLVYEWFGYALLHRRKQFCRIFPAGGIQFSARSIQPLIHREGRNPQDTRDFFRCVVVIDKPQAGLLAFGQFSAIVQCHDWHQNRENGLLIFWSAIIHAPNLHLLADAKHRRQEFWLYWSHTGLPAIIAQAIALIMNERGKQAKAHSALREFLASEAAGGLMLMAAAALAMLAANSAFADDYFHFVHAVTGPELTPKLGPMTVHLWINDGLMAVFFLLVGLEIKREWIDGHLSNWDDRRLPIIAAIAGMALPAAFYLVIAGGEPGLVRGWAIPAATDIAFAIGVLALLGKKAPASLKLFLTTVAIVDDMGAVAIIAIAYTEQLSLLPLAGAFTVLGLLYAIGRRRERRLLPYVAGFALVWILMLMSGVHATIAGVATALVVPIKPSPGAPDEAESPLHRLEHALAKPVAFVIVPLFGFANAGVSLAGISLASLVAPLPLGIALGLFLGKQFGIFGSVWLAVKLKVAVRPKNASWAQVYGVALLCGIGFTMSLFIGGLAFADAAQKDAVKIGVLIGSLLSAVAGALILYLAKPPRRNLEQEL